MHTEPSDSQYLKSLNNMQKTDGLNIDDRKTLRAIELESELQDSPPFIYLARFTDNRKCRCGKEYYFDTHDEFSHMSRCPECCTNMKRCAQCQQVMTQAEKAEGNFCYEHRPKID